MRKAGMTRPMDGLGRVVIPMEFRKAMGFKTGALYEIEISKNDEIILKLHKKQCYECGETNQEQLITKENLVICKKCIVKFYKEIN